MSDVDHVNLSVHFFSFLDNNSALSPGDEEDDWDLYDETTKVPQQQVEEQIKEPPTQKITTPISIKVTKSHSERGLQHSWQEKYEPTRARPSFLSSPLQLVEDKNIEDYYQVPNTKNQWTMPVIGRQKSSQCLFVPFQDVHDDEDSSASDNDTSSTLKTEEDNSQSTHVNEEESRPLRKMNYSRSSTTSSWTNPTKPRHRRMLSMGDARVNTPPPQIQSNPPSPLGRRRSERVLTQTRSPHRREIKTRKINQSTNDIIKKVKLTKGIIGKYSNRATFILNGSPFQLPDDSPSETTTLQQDLQLPNTHTDLKTSNTICSACDLIFSFTVRRVWFFLFI